MQNDVIILGHGLAGAVLAETLLRRGLTVHVFDKKREGNASLVAAGVVNPIVFKRDIPSWRADEMLPIANDFYTAWQQRTGQKVWHALPIVKVFPGITERDQWERVMDNTPSATFITRRKESDVDAAPINAPFGYGTVTEAAWLNVPELLAFQKEVLIKTNSYTELDVDQADIQHGDHGIRIGAVHAKWLIRCTGPFANIAGLAPVKGETLVVKILGLGLKSMIHRKVFVLPLGNDVYRVGATFDWTNVWTGTTEEAKADLLEMLISFVNVPVEVLEHNSGARPATKDRRPLLGKLSEREAVFNGLGSRGVLLAPWCASHLVDHLFSNVPMDAEVDLARFG